MEEIYTYLGYAIIAVLIYLIFKTIFVSKQSEGFFGTSDKKNDDTKDDTKEDTKDSSDDPRVTHQGEAIEAMVTKVENGTNQKIKQANYVKNRKHWENLIIALEDNINTSSIQQMAALSSKLIANPEDPAIISAIEKLNTLNNYKQTLKDNMTFLDGLA
jgi:hypothetical protein